MTEEEAEKYFNEGVKFFSLTNYLSSINSWSKVKKGNSLYFTALGNIGLAYRNIGEYEIAIKYCKKIPKFHNAYFDVQWTMDYGTYLF